VPFNFSPNMVRNMVKLMGPGASFIMASKYSSVGFFPKHKRSLIKLYYETYQLLIKDNHLYSLLLTFMTAKLLGKQILSMNTDFIKSSEVVRYCTGMSEE
jgi:hypothetical protein